MGAAAFADVCDTLDCGFLLSRVLHIDEMYGANRDAAASVAEVLMTKVGSLGYSAVQRTVRRPTCVYISLQVQQVLSVSRNFYGKSVVLLSLNTNFAKPVEESI
jgi:hypothetical protein